MTAALEGGEWSAARPGRTLTPGMTRYAFYRRLGGLQSRSGRAENLVPTGIRSRTVQAVVSRVSLQLPQFKQQVIETGQSQEFQDSLSREYPGLVHSVLRAQSPIYSFSQFCCLLVLTALTPVSNTVLHRCTPPLTPHYAVPQLQSPFTLQSLHKLSTKQHVLSPSHDCPALAIRWTYIMLIARLERTSLF